MSDTKAITRTRAFYERYQFPGDRPMDQDGLIFLRHFGRTVAEAAARSPRRPLRVLDAGCGTGNTSVALARQFPNLEILGIDQSANSLKRARQRARDEGLSNVRFRLQDLLSPLADRSPADIVLCLGVLHHTEDMRRVLRNLRHALRPHGVLFLWIYGLHGRARHSLNVRALRILRSGARQKDALAMATEFALHACKGSAIPDLLGNTPGAEGQRAAFEDPIWIADQFINPRETLIDMEGLLDLVSRSGFTIEKNLGHAGDPAAWLGSPVLVDVYRRLSARDQAIVLDLLVKPERYSVMLRPATRKSR
jgi:2-polyprenyl-3-methyl-5-hydroxy-6-metoxy-1,4-benzoquinol methylase